MLYAGLGLAIGKGTGGLVVLRAAEEFSESFKALAWVERVLMRDFRVVVDGAGVGLGRVYISVLGSGAPNAW